MQKFVDNVTLSSRNKKRSLSTNMLKGIIKASVCFYIILGLTASKHN
jgi:hypothetical protein